MDSSSSGQQPQRRKQNTSRQQPANRQQAQPRRQQQARQQQPQAHRQRPAQGAQQAGANGQRQSVRADAARQQQARQQTAQRQQARAQQQAAHRQQMREQTMREHQARMQAQRAQSAAAYSTNKYVARNGRQSRRNAAEDIRAAAQGRQMPAQGRPARPPKSHRKRNIILAVVAALILVIVIPGVAFGVSVVGARDNAQQLMTQGRNIVDQVKAGDMTGAKASAADFGTTAEKLHKDTDNPLWAGATLLPVLGSDINQVRILAEATDMLSKQVVIPVVQGLPEGGMSAFISDGAINVQALQNVLVPLGSSSAAIHECASKLDNAGETHIEQLKAPMDTVRSALGTLDDISAQATELSNVLPGMLGAQGTRTYLLTACSGAELRSTGGFPGSVGLMTITNGKMEVGEFASPALNAPNLSDETKLEITREEERIFGWRIARCFLDTTYNPNFPRAAVLMDQIWERDGNTLLDGIICVDPVFLQRLLALTGGVTTADGTVVDGTNAAEMLMNTVYLKYPDNNDAQDALFAQVASHALGQIFGNLGSVDMAKFMTTLLNSLQDKRFFAWMRNPSEQTVLENLDWASSVSTSETEPEAGVYLSTALGNKINWYLDVDTSVSAGRKNSDGTTSYDVTVILKNKLTEEQAATMPWYITGGLEYKREVSDVVLDVYLYAPVGGHITNLDAQGYFYGPDQFNTGWDTHPGDDPMTVNVYNNNEVWFGVTAIRGETDTTLKYTVTTSANATEELKLDMTPLPNEKLQ